MKEVWDKKQKEAEYLYNSDDTIASIIYANGVNVKYNYDEDKNLTEILTTNKDGEEIFSHSYVYDANGNQVERVENGETTRYIYDRLNRLSKVLYSEGEESFEYDLAGNRIKRSLGNITVSYDYDKRNRLIEKIEGGIQTSYSYDPQGNLIEEEDRRGTTRYTYDCFNRTESVRSANGGYIRNRYDAEGLRFELHENGKVSRFIFSGSEVVTEVDADYGLKAAIIRGHEILAQKDARDSSYYYLNNAHGDVVGLADGRGEVINSYKYDAFGNTVEAKEQIPNRFRYAGEQYDPITGQYYLRARFYNPVVGRFTQEDTYRGDGLNLYSYVQNNPVNYYDPSGYSSCSKKSNTWNDFQKAQKGNYKSSKEAAEAYKRLVADQSPWPDGYVPKERVLRPGETFNMSLDSTQPVTSPGSFGTFDNIPNVDYVRNNLAVKSDWKADCSKVVTYKVKDGVTIPVREGPVGPQIDVKANKYLPGGGTQVQLMLDRSANKMDYLEVVSVHSIT